MNNTILLFIFLFLNIYFPISPYLCLGIDVCLVLVYGNWKSLSSYSSYIAICFILFFFAVMSYGVSVDSEVQVVLKYARNLFSTFILIPLASGIKIKPRTFLNVLSVVFLLHIAAIIAQIIYPPLDWMMAPYFNFDRDIDLVRSMMLRKLGLSGGYDGASMLAVSCAVLFYYRFYQKGKYIFLVLSVISMGMTLFVSRTGMLVSAGCMAYFALISIRKKNAVRRAGILMIGLFAFAIVNLLLPILLESNGMLFDVSIQSDADVSYFTQDYSSANSSAEGLTGSHLNVVRNLDLSQWFFGAGNSSSSDIGYVQMLFQVGLIGLALIVWFHMMLFRRMRKVNVAEENVVVLKSFCLTYIVILFLFNYKILLLYSRGFYDILLICFVYLDTYYRSSIKKIRI